MDKQKSNKITNSTLPMIQKSSNQSVSPMQDQSLLLNSSGYDYVHEATSNNTRKAYQHDVRHFIAWGGLLPSSLEQIIQYLQAHADTHNPRTLQRRITAIRQWHILQGFVDPTEHPLVRKTLKGIQNVHGTPKEKAPPITLEILNKMIASIQPSARLMDLRNQALLLVGFFGAFRRSELVAIHWEHITFSNDGIEILIPHSKTDQGRVGQVCAIPYGRGILCPVKALLRWQESAKLTEGACFRKLTKSGKVGKHAIRPEQINMVIKTLAINCELPNAFAYSSHSLRRGFATEASRRGASFVSIKKQGRWKHEGTVLGYIDEGRRFEENAVRALFTDRK